MRRSASLFAAAGALALTVTTAAPASAATWSTGYSSCAGNQQVVIASQTTGSTTHTAIWGSTTRTWDKGYKTVAGATTYTGRYYVDGARVYASSTVYSAGLRCA